MHQGLAPGKGKCQGLQERPQEQPLAWLAACQVPTAPRVSPAQELERGTCSLPSSCNSSALLWQECEGWEHEIPWKVAATAAFSGLNYLCVHSCAVSQNVPKINTSGHWGPRWARGLQGTWPGGGHQPFLLLFLAVPSSVPG